MSFKYGVILPGEPVAFNAVVFATRQEADSAGFELLTRWFAPESYEVVEVDEPVNYKFENGQTLPLKG